MSTFSNGYIKLAKLPGTTFVNANVNDVMFYTDKAEQSILIGPYSNNGIAPLTVKKDKLMVNGHIVPAQDVVYDLGTPSMRFRDLYLSGSTLHIGCNAISVNSSNIIFTQSDTGAPANLIVNQLQIGTGSNAVVATTSTTGNGLTFYSASNPNNIVSGGGGSVQGITSTGNNNIGIGTTTPLERLAVQGGDISLSNNNTKIILSAVSQNTLLVQSNLSVSLNASACNIVASNTLLVQGTATFNSNVSVIGSVNISNLLVNGNITGSNINASNIVAGYGSFAQTALGLTASVSNLTVATTLTSTIANTTTLTAATATVQQLQGVLYVQASNLQASNVVSKQIQTDSITSSNATLSNLTAFMINGVSSLASSNISTKTIVSDYLTVNSNITSAFATLSNVVTKQATIDFLTANSNIATQSASLSNITAKQLQTDTLTANSNLTSASASLCNITSKQLLIDNVNVNSNLSTNYAVINDLTCMNGRFSNLVVTQSMSIPTAVTANTNSDNISTSNLTVTQQATISNLLVTGPTRLSNVQAIVMTLSNTTITNTATNTYLVVLSNATIPSIQGSNASFSNCVVPGTSTLNSLFSSNLSVSQTTTSLTLAASNASVSNLTVSQITTLTNLTVQSNVTGNAASLSNVIITNTITSSNANLSNLNVSQTATAATINTSNITVGQTAYIATLSNNTSTLSNVYVNLNAFVQNLYTSNASMSNMSVSSNATILNLTLSNANVTQTANIVTLNTSNASLSNATVPGTVNVTTLNANTTSLSNATVPGTANIATLNANTTSLSNAIVPGTANIATLNANTTSLSNATVPGTANITSLNANTTMLSNATVPGTANITSLNANTTMLSNATVPGTANITTLNANTTSLSNVTIENTANITTLNANITGLSNATIPTLVSSNVSLSNARSIVFTASNTSLSNLTVPFTAAISNLSANVSSFSNVTIPGSLGVGTINASYKVNIDGSLNASNIFLNGAAISALGASGFTASGSVVSTTSNVGIGTATPGAPLQVVGSILGDRFLAATQGSVTSPSFSWSNNLTTGLWNPAANIIGFTTGGTQVLTVSSNIGVGLVNPTSKLHVSGDVTSTKVITNDGTVAAPAFSFSSAQNTGVFRSGSNLGLAVNGTECFTVVQSGNVGVGTVSPVTKLQVSGDITACNYDATDGTVATPSYGFASVSNIGMYKSATGLGLVTNGAEQLTIANAGNVGIGTTAPAYKLHVAGTAAVTNVLNVGSSIYSSNIVSASKFVMTSDGSSNVPAITWSNDSQTGIYRIDNGVIGLVSGAPSLSNLVWVGSNVGIGVAQPFYKLHVDGQIHSTVDVTATSDIRMKKELVVIENALDKVRKINGYTFTSLSDYVVQTSNGRRAGVIAQEIESVLPEVVYEDGKGYKSVAYGNLTALLIEAIKEQNDMISNLNGIVQVLNNRLNALENYI